MILCCCAIPIRAVAESKAPLRVVSTVGMITDMAARIGGERVAVQGLMGEGIDPHLYKASPNDVRLLTDADLIFYGGLNLEGKMADLFVRLARKKPTIAVSEYIDEKLLREPPEFAGHYDPHIWFDVSLWMKAAERIRDALQELDPEGKALFQANASTLLAQLAELHQWCRAQIQSIPSGVRVLITAHDAFGYFGRAYGIEVKGIQGISTESEASLKDINSLVDLIVGRGIPAVFVESSVPRKTIEALVEGARARKLDLQIGGELFSDALGKAGTAEGSYIGMVQHNVRTIVKALTKAK
jgi:manganese/zinc/iron transport system substrate-binding protein